MSSFLYKIYLPEWPEPYLDHYSTLCELGIYTNEHADSNTMAANGIDFNTYICNKTSCFMAGDLVQVV